MPMLVQCRDFRTPSPREVDRKSQLGPWENPRAAAIAHELILVEAIRIPRGYVWIAKKWRHLAKS